MDVCTSSPDHCPSQSANWACLVSGLCCQTLYSSAYGGERNRGSRWKQGRQGGRSLVLPEYSGLVGTTVQRSFPPALVELCGVSPEDSKTVRSFSMVQCSGCCLSAPTNSQMIFSHFPESWTYIPRSLGLTDTPNITYSNKQSLPQPASVPEPHNSYLAKSLHSLFLSLTLQIPQT